jgi:hypothetical protein
MPIRHLITRFFDLMPAAFIMFIGHGLGVWNGISEAGIMPESQLERYNTDLFNKALCRLSARFSEGR